MNRLVLLAVAAAAPILVAVVTQPGARAWLRGTGSVRQTLSNVSVGVVFLASQVLLRGALVGVFVAAARIVPWKLPAGWPSYVLTFVLLDLVYYLQHRLEHALPVLWAVHSVHHQSRDYNLSVSLRVGVLASLSTAVFHSSLALAGVGASVYAVVGAAHAALLFGLHARTKVTLGPGRVFNAPVFHRVHHGADRASIDRNFGGVFLVWDRLFGTFAPYTGGEVFGVAGEDCPELPLEANVAPWVALGERLRAEATFFGKLRALVVRRSA